MLEEENSKLKKLLAERDLEVNALREVIKKTHEQGQGSGESYYKISKKLWHEGKKIKRTLSAFLIVAVMKC